MAGAARGLSGKRSWRADFLAGELGNVFGRCFGGLKFRVVFGDVFVLVWADVFGVTLGIFALGCLLQSVFRNACAVVPGDVLGDDFRDVLGRCFGGRRVWRMSLGVVVVVLGRSVGCLGKVP